MGPTIAFDTALLFLMLALPIACIYAVVTTRRRKK
jgi:hypothetical protein